MNEKTIALGDYVLATKFSDGDPYDHWCVGFFAGMLPYWKHEKYLVRDGMGNLIRANGFRRVKKISPACGTWMLENLKTIERLCLSIWTIAQLFESISDHLKEQEEK